MPWLRRALRAVTVFTGAAMLATCFLDTFWCGRQVSVNWSLDESACNTFDSKLVFRIDWASNIMTDLLSELLVVKGGWTRYDTNASKVCILPFPLLHRLQLNGRQVWGLIVTFSLGAITISVSVVRFATIEVIEAWTNVCTSSTSQISVFTPPLAQY